MKIGIDISQIIYSTGVSTYTYNLIKALFEIDHNNEYVLYAGSLRGYPKIFKIGNSLIKANPKAVLKSYLLPPTATDVLWNKFHFLNIEHFTGEIDVFHASDWTQPPSKAYKVTTIHDLVPLLYPKLSDPKIVSVHKRRLEIVKKECDSIIVPTKSVQKDLLKLGFDLKRINLISEATDPKFVKQNAITVAKTMGKYHIRGKYILVMGTDPRKNIGRILASFMKVKTKKDLKLVIVGHPVRVKDETRGVIYTGRISQNDVICLYSGAEMLLYPSLYEGFGLPILEAYAVGTPVITSKIGSMAEVAGDGACLVDPYNVEDITEAIFKVIKDKKKYIRVGKKELEKYSWEKTAQQTLKVYEKSQK